MFRCNTRIQVYHGPTIAGSRGFLMFFFLSKGDPQCLNYFYCCANQRSRMFSFVRALENCESL